MESVRPLLLPIGFMCGVRAVLRCRRPCSLLGAWPPRPCSHSLPVGASASMLWRSLRLLPHRRAHDAVCMPCGVACVLSLGRAQCGHLRLV
jgi:hypothetical protein